jgi:hypothetical protein
MSPWLATNRKLLPVPESRLKLAPNTARRTAAAVCNDPDAMAFETIRLNRPAALPGLREASVAEVADERRRRISEFIRGRD